MGQLFRPTILQKKDPVSFARFDQEKSHVCRECGKKLLIG